MPAAKQGYPLKALTGLLLALGPNTLIGLVLALAAAPALSAESRPLDSVSAAFWLDSPYRAFRAPRTLLAGRAVLIDEAEDPALEKALSSELRRIWSDVFAKQGWRSPFADGEVLRVYVTRRQADGLRSMAARSSMRGRLVAPAVLLDGSGLSARQIASEAARLVLETTLAGYGAPDSTFLTKAAAESLASPREGEEEREAARLAASGAEIAVGRHVSTLGRLYVEEFVREAGAGALRVAFERSSQSGEELLPVFLRTFTEVTGRREEELLLRFAARLYSSLEVEAGPSRIGLLDLETGGFNAASPGLLVLRHRTYLPADPVAALRVAWPEDGGTSAAVVRYRDPALPADVIFLEPGAVKTVPLSGVARVDWIVAGRGEGPPNLAVPALFEGVAEYPFTGLFAHAEAPSEGPRLWWTTGSHEQLLGWAIFREELLPDGRIARTGPELLPASVTAQEPFRYTYLDTETSAGVYYRYTIWAITEEGLLARAFSAILRTPY